MANETMCNEQIALELVKLSMGTETKKPIELYEEFIKKVCVSQQDAFILANKTMSGM